MEEAHIVVDVQASPLSESKQLEASPLSEAPIILDLKASLLSESMQHKLDKRNEANNFTIFRAPHNISESRKNLFEPCAVSIGPFHRGDQKHLRAMEEQKWQFLQDFLSHADHISLDLCISEMKSLEKRTRGCYSETVDLDSNAFVEMMLLDGCFVLEYFSKLYEGNFNYSRVIYNDLLLVENQIPFFIVEKLCEIGLKLEDIMDFVKYIALFLLEDVSIGSIAEMPDLPAEIYHLVHLYYHYLVPNPQKPVVLISKSFFSLPNSIRNTSSFVIPSATELKQKGVKFTPKSNPKHMLDISFEYGVLKIPRLEITDDTKPIFANLIAFEQSNYGKEHLPFTTFVIFLDNLVNIPNDVTILQEYGIVENWLGSEEELTSFINQATQGAMFESDHYLAELFMVVNRYIASHRIKQKCYRQLENLIHEYFSSPWKVISLIAAFILLGLTCVQTFYAVYAYKFPPSS